jgi:hypothetical protein
MIDRRKHIEEHGCQVDPLFDMIDKLQRERTELRKAIINGARWANGFCLVCHNNIYFGSAYHSDDCPMIEEHQIASHVKQIEKEAREKRDQE